MEFGSYLAVGMATVSPSTPARELRSKVQKVLQELRALEADITRKTSTLHQKLTAKNSAVKEFVEASLDDTPEGDIVSRANALQICYKQLGPQVATDVRSFAMG